jgi:hypothetical protein
MVIEWSYMDNGSYLRSWLMVKRYVFSWRFNAWNYIIGDGDEVVDMGLR